MKPKYKTKLKKCNKFEIFKTTQFEQYEKNKFEIFKTSQFEKYAKRKDVARVHQLFKCQ